MRTYSLPFGALAVSLMLTPACNCSKGSSAGAAQADGGAAALTSTGSLADAAPPDAAPAAFYDPGPEVNPGDFEGTLEIWLQPTGKAVLRSVVSVRGTRVRWEPKDAIDPDHDYMLYDRKADLLYTIVPKQRTMVAEPAHPRVTDGGPAEPEAGPWKLTKLSKHETILDFGCDDWQAKPTTGSTVVHQLCLATGYPYLPLARIFPQAPGLASYADELERGGLLPIKTQATLNPKDKKANLFLIWVETIKREQVPPAMLRLPPDFKRIDAADPSIRRHAPH